MQFRVLKRAIYRRLGYIGVLQAYFRGILIYFKTFKNAVSLKIYSGSLTSYYLKARLIHYFMLRVVIPDMNEWVRKKAEKMFLVFCPRFSCCQLRFSFYIVICKYFLLLYETQYAQIIFHNLQNEEKLPFPIISNTNYGNINFPFQENFL